MLAAMAKKTVRVIDPAAIVDDASYTTEEIDTLGFDYAEIVCYVGATDIDMVALKVQESDVSGSGFTDVTGLVAAGAAGDGRLPQDDDDNKFFTFFVDLRGRKRYLDLVATAGDGTAGTFMAALCNLYRAKEGPRTSAQQGLASQLSV